MEKWEPSSGALIQTTPVQLHVPPPSKNYPENGAFSVRKEATV